MNGSHKIQHSLHSDPCFLENSVIFGQVSDTKPNINIWPRLNFRISELNIVYFPNFRVIQKTERMPLVVSGIN